MSRLGDLMRTERLRRGLSYKQVARLGGVSEGYLQEVEAGTRIIADDQARRILKKMGLSEQTEAGFTLDDIAATVDLETVKPAKLAQRPAAKKDLKVDEAVYSTQNDDKNPQTQGGIWLDALASVLKRVPVYNAVMKEIDHKLLPILDGRIEGASPEKVFYLSVPDDSMRGFRILRDDLCLIVPAASPIDEAVMLVEIKQRRVLRKVKKLDALHVSLQSYDREYSAETYSLPDISFIGQVVRVEFSL